VSVVFTWLALGWNFEPCFNSYLLHVLSPECKEWHQKLRNEVKLRERQVQAAEAYGSEDNYRTQQAMVSKLLHAV
jgi:hypothetical protein